MNYHEYERAMIFFERKTLVHASTARFFTNGLILEVGEKHVVIKDRVDGTEKFILFEELVKPLEKCISKEEHNGRRVS